MRLMIKPNS